MLDLIKEKLNAIKNDNQTTMLARRRANALYMNGQCQLLTCAGDTFHFSIEDIHNDFELFISVGEEQIDTQCSCKSSKCVCHHTIAGLLELSDNLQRDEAPQPVGGKTYTREGMIKRVMEERRDKADKAEYLIEFADNVFGEHELTNERDLHYRLTFRDPEKEQGYCSCPDYRTNKLGTCKHLLYAFSLFRETEPRTLPDQPYPFIEIYLDPLDEYRISWFYPQQLPAEAEQLLNEYFTDEQKLREDRTADVLDFIERSREIKEFLVRPEVLEQIETFFEHQLLEKIKTENSADFSTIKAKLFDYQQEGITFAAFRKSAIIADEMGLGKTVQAIGSAIAKKRLFGFERTLVICPASLKAQWKSEIEKFSNETAVIIQGTPEERGSQYRNSNDYFAICNYEATLRDLDLLRDYNPDLIILDEAQRIKNYETRTAASIKQIPKKHGLVLTGTPIENRLVDLYSIVDFLDPHMLSPLWEFSSQHCCFDVEKKNRISGYYNLQQLKERLQPILIRREKREVIKQLPQISQLDIPIKMHPCQAGYHADYANGVAQILRKKFLTPFDHQKVLLLLAKMRMVCDSTFLVDPERDDHYSPKLDELRHILLDKLDIKQSSRKVVIFSEWVRMNHIISRMLRDNDIGFVELNGKVPVAKRTRLIEEFESNDTCQVFLSTEAGGVGLNLQAADSVINFELPWNPAKKNQRIGRIDRLGQKSEQLTVINLIMQESIETRIADGLLLKQNLFEGVLNNTSSLDSVDFSERGRSQFLQQLEESIEQLAQPPEIEEELPTPPLEDEMSNPLREPTEPDEPKEPSTEKPTKDAPTPATSGEQLEQVMNQGMAFLSGLMQMTTGQPLQGESNKIEVNPETGEVVMRFKLPGMSGQGNEK
ncbi:MAG: DEAD/DEAH box helicase [Thermodesulfobacteriota bacterium]|nr:DEAD/DEAH box helicase [Thermodesulfobacteriota bacterium]